MIYIGKNKLELIQSGIEMVLDKANNLLDIIEGIDDSTRKKMHDRLVDNTELLQSITGLNRIILNKGDRFALVYVPVDKEAVLVDEPHNKGLTADDYLDALNVQDASNLSGVVLSFSEVIKKIRNEARLSSETNNGDWISNHPIARMYANKIKSLTNASDSGFEGYYNQCREKAGVS